MLREYDEINIELIHFDGSKESIKTNNIIEKGNKLELKEACYFEKDVYNNCNHKDFYFGEVEANEPGLINYYFTMKQGENILYYGNSEENLGGIGKIYHRTLNYIKLQCMMNFKFQIGTRKA